MKKLIIIFLILIFIGGGIYFSYQFLKSEVVRRLEKNFQAKITYETFEINPFKGLRAAGIKIGNFFKADSINISFSLRDIFSGKMEVFYAKNAFLDIDSLTASREKNREKKSEISTPLPPATEIKRLIVYGGHIKVGKTVYEADTILGSLLGKEAIPSYRLVLKAAILAGIPFDEIHSKLTYENGWKLESLHFKGPYVHLNVGLGTFSYPELRLDAYGLIWGKALNLREGSLFWNLKNHNLQLNVVETQIAGRLLDTLSLQGILAFDERGGYLGVKQYALKAPEGKLRGAGWIKGFLKGFQNIHFSLDFKTDSMTFLDKPLAGLVLHGSGNISGTINQPELRADFKGVSFKGYNIPHLSGRLIYLRPYFAFEDVRISDSTAYVLLNGSYSPSSLLLDFQGGIKDFSDLPYVAIRGIKGEFNFSGALHLNETKREFHTDIVGKNVFAYSISAKNFKAHLKGWDKGNMGLALYNGRIQKFEFDSVSMKTGWGKGKEFLYKIFTDFKNERSLLLSGKWKMNREFTAEISKMVLSYRKDTMDIENPLLFSKRGRWISLKWENVKMFGGNLEYLIGALGGEKKEADFRLRLRGFDLKKFGEFVGMGDSLGGKLGLYLKVRGSTVRPQGEVRVHIEKPQIGKFSGNSLTLLGDYSKDRFTFDTLNFVGFGTRVDGRLEVPFELSFSPFVARTVKDSIRGSLKTPGVDVSILSRLIGAGFAMEAGTLKADMRLSGTTQKPVFSGEFSLKSKAAVIGPLNLEMSKLRANGRLRKDTIFLDSLKAFSGKGYVTGRGLLLLEQFKPKWLDAGFDLKRLKITPDPNSEVVVTGNFKIKGSSASPTIYGDTHIDEAFIYLPFGSERSGTSPSPSPVKYYIKIRGEKGIFVMNELMNVELGGDLEVKKEDEINTTVSGKLNVVSGTFLYADRIFKISDGQIEFQGEPKINPTLNIVGETRIEDTIEVTLHLTGTVKKPRIDISSVPPLPQEDIIAYLTFGRPLSEIPLSLTDVNLLRERALGLAEGLLSAELRRKLRVSELELGTGLLGGDPHFTVGLYLSRNFYLKYSFDPQSIEKNVFLTRYFLTRRTALYAQRDREGEVAAGFEIFFRF